MSFDNVSVANELVTVLSGLSGMGAAQIGAPASIGPKVSSYVTMGGQNHTRKAAGLKQRETRFFCMFAYRVDGAEATAEIMLMTLVDAFVAALNADLTLNGTVKALEMDSSTADEPEYQLRAGKEYREYPIIVTVVQQDTYAINP